MNKTRVRPQLPRKIKVGKKMYTIDIVESMLERGHMAAVYYADKQIKIGTSSNVTGKKFSADDIHDSFWHELVHAILFDMDEYTLNRNEKFVTEFATKLADAIKSARFE